MTRLLMEPCHEFLIRRPSGTFGVVVWMTKSGGTILTFPNHFKGLSKSKKMSTITIGIQVRMMLQGKFDKSTFDFMIGGYFGNSKNIKGIGFMDVGIFQLMTPTPPFEWSKLLSLSEARWEVPWAWSTLNKPHLTGPCHGFSKVIVLHDNSTHHSLPLGKKECAENWKRLEKGGDVNSSTKYYRISTSTSIPTTISTT